MATLLAVLSLAPIVVLPLAWVVCRLVCAECEQRRKNAMQATRRVIYAPAAWLVVFFRREIRDKF